MPDDKPASEWTPRDHYVRATALMQRVAEQTEQAKGGDAINYNIYNLLEMAEVHTALAAIPASNVQNYELDEDYRP